MKLDTSLVLSLVAVVLVAVAQVLVYPDSGWNAGLLLLGGSW